ncbi:hypothetical protein GIB67_039892 [Kingdonia uniflora]|uniref:Uncharacterized protein n=1 Tax=Kingdonia uniflora TaxID=39325 RepID=A0A7J7P3D5_9MAGN|nr:hypothetical protein GIB67_039892 [Kingdonia uniflora]
MDDNLKEVEEKAKLAALHGEEEMSKMAARLIKGLCLGVEEEKAELKRKKVELKRNVARLKTDLLKEGKWMEALKASQVVGVNNIHAKARENLEEVVAERDRLGRHLMSKGYFKDEVDAIRADTYIEEEEDEEIEDVTVRVVGSLNNVSPQTMLDNQGDDNKCPKGETEKELKDIRLRIKDLEAELTMERYTSALLLSSFPEARERSRKNKNDAKVSLVQGDVVSLSTRIRELKGGVTRIQGHVRKGVERLRESKRKLDAALSRE